MDHRHTATGIPVPTEHREALRRLIAEHGEAGALEILGMSRSAVLRSLAGLGVRQGTAALLEMRLAQVLGDRGVML